VNPRLRQLISRFDSHHIDAFLVTRDVNIRYLTGFPACESWLLVGRKKSFYITDFRYILEARKGLQGIAVKRYEQSVYKTIGEMFARLKAKRLGFDEQHVTLSFFKKLKRENPSIDLRSAKGLVEHLREIKTSEEIRLIKKAIQLNLKVYEYIKGFLKVGMTELQVLERCERFVKDRGAVFSFPPIIASGPNACFPHAKVTTRRLKNNEALLVDLGVELKGYKSDLTRIFFLGRIPRPINNIYNFVAEAQQKAISRIKAGVKACDVDRAARKHLDKNKLGKYFGHSLGHGVGLDIHESPRISLTNPAVLKAGMVITVEPAVYVPQKFGIRIEDMVLVTEKGCEVLSDNWH